MRTKASLIIVEEDTPESYGYTINPLNDRRYDYWHIHVPKRGLCHSERYSRNRDKNGVPRQRRWSCKLKGAVIPSLLRGVVIGNRNPNAPECRLNDAPEQVGCEEPSGPRLFQSFFFVLCKKDSTDRSSRDLNDMNPSSMLSDGSHNNQNDAADPFDGDWGGCFLVDHRCDCLGSSERQNRNCKEQPPECDPWAPTWTYPHCRGWNSCGHRKQPRRLIKATEPTMLGYCGFV